jgi:purine-binding chemotaxis protein CheW
MSNQTTADLSTDRISYDKSGKYLTFILGDESYGLEIIKVREIIGMMKITPVPRTPDYVKGVINLRGRIIPVVDLRAKFGLDRVEETPQTCIIVVDITDGKTRYATGIFVDAVSEVLNIAEGSIEDSPDFMTTVNMEFILGIAKTESGIKILLDIQRVLGKEYSEIVQQIMPGAESTAPASTAKTSEAEGKRT